jgi:predicted chitinase
MKAVFDAIRKDLFGGKMTQGQVNGVETLLAATNGLDIRERAYLLATAFHETAFTMQPIAEYGKHSYFDKYEPNTKIGIRLGNTRPGDGFLFRGRGYVQITGRANYLRASQKLGVDLVAMPDGALNPDLAARILVKGCTEGWFTGKKLSDYGDYVNMRRVVNGTDRAEQIAEYARQFEKALRFIPPKTPPAMDLEAFGQGASQSLKHDGFWLSFVSSLVAVLEKFTRK